MILFLVSYFFQRAPNIFAGCLKLEKTVCNNSGLLLGYDYSEIIGFCTNALFLNIVTKMNTDDLWKD